MTQAEQRQRWRNEGLCAYCGTEPAKGSKLCRKHREQRRAQWRKLAEDRKRAPTASTEKHPICSGRACFERVDAEGSGLCRRCDAAHAHHKALMDYDAMQRRRRRDRLLRAMSAGEQ